jgi:hypothetical protein
LIKIKIWDTYFRIILMSFFVYSKMIMSFQWIFFYSPLSMTLTIYFKVNYNQYCFVSFIYNWKVSLESYLCYVWKMLEKTWLRPKYKESHLSNNKTKAYHVYLQTSWWSQGPYTFHYTMAIHKNAGGTGWKNDKKNYK